MKANDGKVPTLDIDGRFVAVSRLIDSSWKKPCPGVQEQGVMAGMGLMLEG